MGVERPKPYTNAELMLMAINSPLTPRDPMRVLATYADQSNWYHTNQDQRNHWAWCGPTIVGWEMADHTLRHVAPTPPVELTDDECKAVSWAMHSACMLRWVNPRADTTAVLDVLREHGFRLVREAADEA